MSQTVSTAKPAKEGTSNRVFALVGNPNAGKTTLFNTLTGLRQKVGNYPGVTVERKEGTFFSQHGKPLKVIDLPGAYSLTARSPDEAIMQDVLMGRRPDTPCPDSVVCIIDATNLERNLFFATQIIEMGLPVILVLSMMDIAEKRGIKINIPELEKLLSVTVVTSQPKKSNGTIALRIAMSRTNLLPSSWQCPVGHNFEKALKEIKESLIRARQINEGQAYGEAYLLLTDGLLSAAPGAKPIDPATVKLAKEWQLKLDCESSGWRSDLISKRYSEVSKICQRVVKKSDPNKPSLTEYLDRIILHPILGFAILIGVMGFLFYIIFTLATYPMAWIDEGFGLLNKGVLSIMPPGELRNLIVDGILSGIGGIVIFLPQILLLFFTVGLLESTGYMARAAFLLDKLMSKVGLHGQSFIPLLSSYACAIPGIMSTRTIESPKDRLATILVAPFMTCSARLPVYLVMIAALLPNSQSSSLIKAGLLLALYVIGTITAFIFAWIFKKTLLRSGTSNMIMEMPSYKLPSIKHVSLEMLNYARIFLKKAGTIILGLSIILWFLMNYPKVDTDNKEQLSNSIVGQAGKLLEPILEPLGYDWKINIGVMTSFAAREIFVSTMSIIYNVEADDVEANHSLVANLRNQKRSDGTPVFTPLTCLSLMIFYVFALQCLSTLVVVKVETNSYRWPIFMLVYMSMFAYLASLTVYQGGKLLGFS